MGASQDALEPELFELQRNLRDRAIDSLEAVFNSARAVAAERAPQLLRNGRLSDAKLFSNWGGPNDINRQIMWSAAKGLRNNREKGAEPLSRTTLSVMLQLGRKLDVSDQFLKHAEETFSSYTEARNAWQKHSDNIGTLETRFFSLQAIDKEIPALRTQDLSDKDALESFCKFALREPMVRSKPETALENVTIISAYMSRIGSSLIDSSECRRSALAVIFSHCAFICYRLGDSRHGLFVNQMRALNLKPQIDWLQQAIWLHEHYANLSSEAALKALNLADARHGLISKNGLKKRVPELDRVFVFASEVGIHRGAGLFDRLSSGHGVRIDDLLWQAHEAALDRSELDSAFRFRTVRIRALLWANDLDKARREQDRLDAELEEVEAHMKTRLEHVRHRIAIDKALFHHLCRDTESSEEMALHWLGVGRKIAKAAGAPFLTTAHKREYGKKWANFLDDDVD